LVQCGEIDFDRAGEIGGELDADHYHLPAVSKVYAAVISTSGYLIINLSPATSQYSHLPHGESGEKE
jgi:hypothetical protein